MALGPGISVSQNLSLQLARNSPLPLLNLGVSR